MRSESVQQRAEEVPVIRAEEIFAIPPPGLVVDLRSPLEFAEDHIPGAVNLALFDDEERRVIGTLYNWTGPEAAFRKASQRTREKIVDFVAAVGELTNTPVPRVDLGHEVTRRTRGGLGAMESRQSLTNANVGDPIVFHCWRGGLRSRSVVALLRDLGWDRAVGLEGGYKAYRAVVRARIAGWSGPPAVCLRGLTGVGKTLILRELERLRPGWTIDLEGLAAHRSSILGGVGLEPVSQRRFESRLMQRLHAGFPGPIVYEGESRKVGDIILPEPIWRSMCAAVDLELCAPLERRVGVLVEDYLEQDENRSELAQRLPFIERRLGVRKWQGVLVELLHSGREEELVRVLLERYYDPLYQHSEHRYAYSASFDASDPAAAAEAVAAWIDEYRAR